MGDENKNPEQIARDAIDARLSASGWTVQRNRKIDLSAGPGVAVREYPTSIGPADYALFADRKALGVVEAKPDSWGAKITTVEAQSSGYAEAQLKWVKSPETPALRLRGDRRSHALHRWPGPQAALARGLHLPPPGDAARLARAAESFRAGAPRPAAAQPDRPARLPDHRHHQPGSLAEGGPPPRARPDGDRLGQDLHRHHRGLSPAEVRRRPARPLPRGHAEPRRTGGAGVHVLRPERRQPEVHRALHRPAPVLVLRLAAGAGLHLDHPAHVFDPEGRGAGRGRRGREPGRARLAPQGAAAGRLQPEAAARVLRRRHHRRVPPVDLQPLAAGDRVFRQLPDRPHRHARQPDLRLLPEERRQRIHPREGRRRRRERRQRGLRDRDRGHAGGREAAGRAADREARAPDPREAVGDAGRRRGLRRLPARPLGGEPRPDPHGDPHLPRQAARNLPRPRGGAEDPDLRQDRQPRRRHHPDRPAGVRRGQRLLQEDHLPGRGRPEVRPVGLPQRLLPAHRRDRGHDRHRHRREAARMPALHARREIGELLRADEGPRHPGGEARRPAQGHALGRRQDPLRHRRRRRRHEVDQDAEPPARHQARPSRSATSPWA